MNVKNPQHYIVCSMPNAEFGYFGWPSMARQQDGTLVVVASGLRMTHVCPWGRTILCKSKDEGKTWTAPLVINNTPLDDRDAGVVALPDGGLAVTWFTSDTSFYLHTPDEAKNPQQEKIYRVLKTIQQETIDKYLDCWLRISPDGEYWGEPLRTPVNTPHGFIVLKDGSWLYLGTDRLRIGGRPAIDFNPIYAVRSTDRGRTWEKLGAVPLPEGVSPMQFCEPHVVELPSGKLVGVVRQNKPFQCYITESLDGGRSWSACRLVGINGAPGHLLYHSSGALICTYGHRAVPFGECIAVSRDEGKTWDTEIFIQDNAPTNDLGYPCTVELPNGDLLTVYYTQVQPNEGSTLPDDDTIHCFSRNASLVCTRWQLP